MTLKHRLFLFMETERLILRKYAEEDKTDFIELFTDTVVMKHVGDGVLSREKAVAFWNKLFGRLYPEGYDIWAVFVKNDFRYIGHAGIYPRPHPHEKDWEFVYFLNQKSWGKGYATEIARRIVEYAFEELKLPEVFATVDDDHKASIHVLEKAGMKFKNYEYDEAGRYSLYSIGKENLILS